MMAKARIPKPAQVTSTTIKKPGLISAADKIVFSFESLERTEYFNLDCTCENWFSDLFDMLKNISGISKKDLFSGKFRTYRIHSHETAKPPNRLPDGVALKDLYQMRIGTSKGGIHGIFYDNIFYVIWLDPLHNMYPDSRFGGLRKIKAPKTCCMDRDEQLIQLQNENQTLKEELKLWNEESLPQ